MQKFTKGELREIFKREIENTELTKLSVISAEISKRYMKLLEFEKARDIFTYVSVKKEFDTRYIIENALLSGKNVYVPRIVSKVSDGAKMEFVKIDRLSDLNRKTFGIPEPAQGKAVDPLSLPHPIEMIVPGLCFDFAGNRIGQGGGYYDRYLGGFPEETFHRTALVYDFSIVTLISEDIVTGYDKKMNLIVSENRIIAPNEA